MDNKLVMKQAIQGMITLAKFDNLIGLLNFFHALVVVVHHVHSAVLQQNYNNFGLKYLTMRVLFLRYRIFIGKIHTTSIVRDIF